MSTLPGGLWRALAHDGLGPTGGRPLRGLDAWAASAAGSARHALRSAGGFMARAERVVAMEHAWKDVSERRLDEAITDLRAVVRRGRGDAATMDRALAVIREAAFRELGLRPFAVQVAGALVMAGGGIAEMATGEGKTLTATMPATLAGWRGRGCHVVTANDYLAQRDAVALAPLYRRLGVTVGHVVGGTGSDDRRRAYTMDVTYCTSKEAAADYLRDRLAMGGVHGLAPVLAASIAGSGGAPGAGLVQRGLAEAIVDEADFVLIDEAVTPLIISEPTRGSERPGVFRHAARVADGLVEGEHYRVDRVHREVRLSERGRERIEALAAGMGAEGERGWAARRRREELVTEALLARELFERDRQYIVRGDEVVIVDESTGRLMPDRSWRHGLHQAVEAKEGLTVRAMKETRARISFQRYFRLYRRLSGMTGTAREGAGEFWSVYRLGVVALPTNRACIREQRPELVVGTQREKWDAVVAETQRERGAGRPVLIGTRSIVESETLSARLWEAGVEHRVLNARRHEEEAAIIAEAGRTGRVTVATNMAGRGTDIVLDGGSRAAGGLHVIGTGRHESRRTDRQLFGRAGRQGDPGSAMMISSLDDDLVTRFGGGWTGFSGLRRGILGRVQRRAERLAAAQRRAVLESDDWLDDWLGFAGRE